MLRTILLRNHEASSNENPENKQNMKTIYQTDADVIVTATVLGFCGTRYYLNQPCRFDIEHPGPQDYIVPHGQTEPPRMKPDKEDKFIREMAEFEMVMSAMSIVLASHTPAMGNYLKDGQSRDVQEGGLITGRAGGAGLDPKVRDRVLVSEETSRNQQALQKPNDHAWINKLYQGRGAYTGIIDDPLNNETIVESTKRVYIRSDKNHDRWRPQGENTKYWGGISGEINNGTPKDPPDGLGKFPAKYNENEKGYVIGYVHGMCTAIIESNIHGTWCHPYEQAIGPYTTKIASCFACTTYMYTAGYPPSSTHLGRGESWVPPGNYDNFAEAEEEQRKEIKNAILPLWQNQIFHYIHLGTTILESAQRHVNNEHKTAVDSLRAKLDKEKGTEAKVIVSNLFLDALTVHASDWKRIRRTLKPIIEHIETYQIITGHWTDVGGDR